MNTEPKSAESAPGASPPPAPLDDIMIAMDVVDTLRHDDLVAERELNEDERRKNLIERLREIYRSQGIEVPDRILEEGVKALEEDRFVYEPPKPGWTTWLARLYVTRLDWGSYVLGALGAVFALWIGWYVLYEVPRQRQVAAVRTELAATIPNRLRELEKEIGALTTQSAVLSGTASLVRRGLAAARAGNINEARTALRDVEDRLQRLQAAYKIQIVARQGEVSGIWRIPKVNREARNYYLIVEAVSDAGRSVPVSILNEETGKRATVAKWAQRVPRDVFESVRADKADDGIINATEVGEKRRGVLDPDWKIPVSGGAITKW